MNLNDMKQMAEYIQVSDEITHELVEKVASLEAELSMVKEASVAKPVGLDPTRITATLEKMASAKLIRSMDREAFQKQISQNPEQLLSMLDKIAEDSASTYSLGRPVQDTGVTVENGRTIKASDQSMNETVANLARKLN